MFTAVIFPKVKDWKKCCALGKWIAPMQYNATQK
jgi:hypothetical protein